MKLPPHEATTAQLGALYPFVASRSLPATGVVVGRDLFGSHFVHDPFELYGSGALSNPNILVMGQIGRGKSAFVKSYLYRQAALGRRIVVFDPKGEYAPLAAALGAKSLRLAPGGSVRLNPLRAATRSRHRGPAASRRSQFSGLASIAAATLGRPPGAAERAALDLALARVLERTGEPTLGGVIAELLSPAAISAREVMSTVDILAGDGRDVALELRRLVTGDLSGMFDGPTSPHVDLEADVVVIDLSAVFDSDALPVVLSCARSALESARSDATTPTIMVIDEAWAVLSNLGAARFLQSSFKLSRAFGVANLAVVHRSSDLASSGVRGSIESQLAEGLLADCETIVCYAQSSAEVAGAALALGIGSSSAALLANLRRGVAMWRVGGRLFLVEHHLSPTERRLVDTDARLMEGRASSFRAGTPQRVRPT